MRSLLRMRDVRFRAQRTNDNTWDVVVGDGIVGYVTMSGVPTWARAEARIRRAIRQLYGKLA